MDADAPIPDTEQKSLTSAEGRAGGRAGSDSNVSSGPSDAKSADHHDSETLRAEHANAKSIPHRGGQPEKKTEPVPTKSRWHLIIAVLAIVTCGLGWLGWVQFSRQEPMETHIDVMGNVDVRQVNLAFKVDGRVDALAVDEGEAAKAGDVIATLDTRYFIDELRVLRAKRDNLAASVAKLEHGSRPEEIEQARAQSADRQAALTKAKEDFHRAENLVDKGGVSRQEFDRYRSTLDSAEAQLKSAIESQRLVEIGPRQEDIDVARALLAEQDANIVQSERRLADAELIAPNDGLILTRARERGAIVQPGETIFTLTLDSPVWVRTYVNERDLGLISPNMLATVITDSAPDRPYAGKIGFISPTAEFTPKAVETRELRTDLVYRLRVIVDNPDRGLRQGMPVTVRLQLREPRRKTFWERVRAAVPEEFNLPHDR